MAPEEFDRLTTQARFVAGVQEGLSHHEEGLVVTNEELGRRLDARFGALPQKR